MDEKKKRGRPPLPPEERKDYNLRYKKYRETHSKQISERKKEYRERHYSVRIFVPKSFKNLLDNLAQAENIAMGQLFITAVEEKYGVTLHKKDTDDV